MSSSAVVIGFLHTDASVTIVSVSMPVMGVCIVSISAASSMCGRARLFRSVRQR